MKLKKIFFITFILLSLTLVNVQAEILYGDLNTDSKVTSTDVSILERYILGSITLTQSQISVSDLNKDNKINTTDVAILERYILNIINTIPINQVSPTVTTTPTQSGNVTYTLVKSSNPTSDELDAYSKIETALNTATQYYNKYTTIKKSLQISYVPSVATADGNSNGSIRFGSNRSYMNHITAMHEIAHTVGVGTTTNWTKLLVNGLYNGSNALSELRAITGNSQDVLKGDSTHFWPYGLNYTSEVKSENDLIAHCKIVNAMKKDGL